MSKPRPRSAGLLLYRIRNAQAEVLIGHMGGPFWAKRDAGGWSIPKGECQEDEDPFDAACREFEEETGAAPPQGRFLELGEARQSSGKRIVAWAIEGDFDPSALRSNTFTMEWPPRSGRQAAFPELDRVGWFDLATARSKLVRGQLPFIDALEHVVPQAAVLTD
jgi:predicted NUDIX family NTP pyrophosphohydrolase